MTAIRAATLTEAREMTAIRAADLTEARKMTETRAVITVIRAVMARADIIRMLTRDRQEITVSAIRSLQTECLEVILPW